MWRGRENEVKGKKRSSCYSQGTSEDSQHVWAGSEQEASRALQWDREGRRGRRARGQGKWGPANRGEWWWVQATGHVRFFILTKKKDWKHTTVNKICNYIYVQTQKCMLYIKSSIFTLKILSWPRQTGLINLSQGMVVLPGKKSWINPLLAERALHLSFIQTTKWLIQTPFGTLSG